MRDDTPPPDSHDEGYFASFTDMLVGVIFIFIILLMIVANNFQAATESVLKVTEDLEATKAEVVRKARDEALSKIRNDMLEKELDAARLKAMEEEKAYAVAKALAEYQAQEAAKAEQEAAPPALSPQEEAAQQARAEHEARVRQDRQTRQDAFHESRAQIIRKIEQAMNSQGYRVAADPNQGILIIPENILFYGSHGELNFWGKQAMAALARNFKKYLPCISPTQQANLIAECSNFNITPNDGLDVIYIDDYPSISGTKEEKLLLAVQRVVSVFNELKTTEPYLDKALKNIHGAPILNIKVNQARRDANQRRNDNAQTDNSVVIRLIMRRP